MVFATGEDVIGTCGRLKSFKLTDTNPMFKLREQALGFTFQKHALLFDDSLARFIRPVSQYVHDWMHGIFAGGVFNIGHFRLFQNLSEGLDIWNQLQPYMEVWHWPHDRMFDPCSAQPFLDRRIKAHPCVHY